MGGHPEEAIPYLQKAVSVSNPHSSAYLYLGHVYQRLGDYKTAWVHYNTGEQLNNSHSGAFIEQIWAIEAGTPLITPKPVEVPAEPLGDAAKPTLPVDKAESVLPEASQPDDFFFGDKADEDQEPSALGPPSALDPRSAAERAFFERAERPEMFHPHDPYAQQELDAFIEWAETLMTDAPLDTNNFLAKELSAHLRGQKTTFEARRITRAFEYLQRHGQNEGMKRLQKNDPALAQEVQRLLSSKRAAPKAPRIHNK